MLSSSWSSSSVLYLTLKCIAHWTTLPCGCRVHARSACGQRNCLICCQQCLAMLSRVVVYWCRHQRAYLFGEEDIWEHHWEAGTRQAAAAVSTSWCTSCLCLDSNHNDTATLLVCARIGVAAMHMAGVLASVCTQWLKDKSTAGWRDNKQQPCPDVCCSEQEQQCDACLFLWVAACGSWWNL